MSAHRFLSAVVSTVAFMLTACGGGASSEAGGVAVGGGAVAEAAPAVEPAISYARQIWVDPSNARASDSNDGSQGAPLMTISRAMQMLQAGDEVVIAPGTYYETISVPTLADGSAPTLIRAQNPGTVIVRGSRSISGWQLDASSGLSDVWSVPWTQRQPQQVFRGLGSPTLLQQIGGTVYGGYPNTVPAELQGLGDIWPGRQGGDQTTMPLNSFFYSASEQKLYVRLSSALGANEPLLVSTAREVLFAPSVHRLTVRGIVFEHSNTSSYYRHGGVLVGGNSNTLDGITARWMDSFCVQVSGDDNIIRNAVVDSCGHLGINAAGARLTISGNEVVRNNLRGFDKWWEAGGMKLIGGVVTDGLVSNNVVAFNRGDGIWFDTSHRRVVIRGNTAAFNEGFGIHYEASYQATISGNLVYGNSMRGIYLLDSPDSVIEDNIVLGHPFEGIAISETGRSTAVPSLKPSGNRVVHNTLGWNDIGRNYIALVLAPGLQANVSDRNAFHSSSIMARMNIGWMSPTNLASHGLAAWQLRSGQDAASTEALGPMPAVLSDALASRRIIRVSDLPVALQAPGAN